ncbi:HyaD/HybD family hydrogenase maturation endopeptidase [Aeromonas simiae]|uniref:HyaD/HybD family hydrogenase maturation endopeptidase n=1 Tax=Aeromonas simiae TaxID=218936 RepID=UPI000A9DFC75|nr:HyaD/HybD family hydrogenase maturation endopeptidase [Aeromonas simiae]MDO2948333.1 HyaD/HybD family hydrogenase maturation endopeptidase [Aeromonas simiae]MDO2955716.1 HyaD/HybD family hydrogenase maturation endopeptidase [Aeromonas simiae]
MGLMEKAPSPVLVLGIGNLLLSDEAVGVRAIEALAERYELPPGVDLLDGGTCGMELIGDMAGREHLIVADAVLTGAAPGSVVILRDGEVPALFGRKISPHQLGLADVLSALHLTSEFPTRLTLVGVVPHSVAPAIGLSEVVAGSLDTAVAQLVAALAESGIGVTPREGNP